MFLLGTSTPERANIFVTRRTHKNLMKIWHIMEGYNLWWHNGNNAKYIGCIVNGKLVKV